MSRRRDHNWTTISVRLLKADHEELKLRAHQRDVSMSRMVAIAIRNEIGPSRHLARIRRCLDRKGWHETGDC